MKALPNPFGEAIEILAPWGELQRGQANCWLVLNGDSRYLIGGAEFSSTYEEVQEA